MLKNKNIEENDIALIANLYWQQKTIVKINNDTSEPLKVEKGVRQGCVLSPALFNLYTDIIFRNIDQRPGIKIGGHTINNLRYADDTVLLAENETEQQILDTVKTESEKYGLFMNVKKKTKSMAFSRNKDITELKLLINGNEIGQVKSFQYLGALVTEDGKCESELNRRKAVAKNNFATMSRILTDHDMSLATKIRLAQCYVWSTLLYGCETW